MEALQHPTNFGFEKAIVAVIGKTGYWDIHEQTAIATQRFMVYAFTDYQKTVFRVGKTTGSLKSRLTGYERVTRSDVKLTKNGEIEDGKRMRECTAGKQFIIWAKPPELLRISIGNGLTVETKSLIANEALWMCYYKPRFGNKLD